MIFLTDFIAKGFKSFANKIDVSFDGRLIGIIGPNGSGKTNFIDGIKWVLGEQSNKELRSRAKNELVFHGSQTIPAATKASVTLKFNNQNRILNLNFDEVVVTKTYDVQKNESTFFINEQVSTLTAVKELFANSGLTKGSLCIISNHSVDWFANAKPAERKEIFISAAGVKPYLENKKEAIKNLNSTQTEIDSLNSKIKYIAKNAESLRSQVGEVEVYNQKYESLKRIELNYYGFNLEKWCQAIADLEKNLLEVNQSIETSNKKIEVIEDRIKVIDRQLNDYDSFIDEYTKKLDDLKQELQDSDQKQFLIKAEREKALNSNDISQRIKAYQEIINSETTNVKTYQEQVNKNGENVHIYEQIIVDQKAKLEKLELDLRNTNNKLNDLKNEKSNLEFRHANALSNERGIKALLSAKNHFNGLYGIVQDYLNIPKKYELAMSFAFAKTLNYFIVEDDKTAKDCIRYLTNNKAGRCTFIPVKDIKAKIIDERTQIALNESKGYLGTASSLIKIEPKYQIVLENLVGNIIIADDLDHANAISKLIGTRYKVIDLEGNVFNPGGIISGGFNQVNNNVIFNYQEKIDELTNDINILELESQKLNDDLIKQKQTLTETQDTLSNKKSQLEISKYNFQSESETLKKHKQEYDALVIQSNKKIDFKVVEDELTKHIIDVNERIKVFEDKLRMSKESRANAVNERSNITNESNELNHFINDSLRSINEKNNALSNLKSKYESAKNRIISYYEMTEENVIENFNNDIGMDETQTILTINRLNNELSGMKNINFQAAEQLKEIEEDLSLKNDQKTELLGTINYLNEIIDKLQKQAVSLYKNLIETINETLPTIFEYLFNGGWCKVSLDESSEDIFEQGINVSVNPIGQKITSLYLLSSGQKTLVALSVLFAILKASNYPLVIFDEAEAALDPNNVVRFSNLIKQYSENTQFIVITHRNGTMQICDYLYGVTMPTPGVSDVIKLNLNDVKKVVTGD